MPAKAKPKSKVTAETAPEKKTTKTDTPVFFRMTVEVTNLEQAAKFYATLLGIEGRKLPRSRLYFDCGPVILQVIDVSASRPSHTSAKSLYFSVANLEAVHKRAKKLKCLSLEMVHEKPGGAIVVRPSGERSFYVDDPWFNALCFVEAGTEHRR